MACEVKYNASHHAGATADARIKSRLRPSNDTAHADSVTTVGHSPTRAVTSVHHSRNQQSSNGARVILAKVM
jgi:hypothetical protein